MKGKLVKSTDLLKRSLTAIPMTTKTRKVVVKNPDGSLTTEYRTQSGFFFQTSSEVGKFIKQFA